MKRKSRKERKGEKKMKKRRRREEGERPVSCLLSVLLSQPSIVKKSKQRERMTKAESVSTDAECTEGQGANSKTAEIADKGDKAERGRSI